MMIKRHSLALCLLLSTTASYAGNNSEYTLHGRLVAEPCTLQTGDEEIAVDFGTIIDKYLYLNQRTHSQPFTLRLLDCDASLAESVAIRFLGSESTTLPGLLAIDTASAAKGIAIGIETTANKPLPINSPTAEKMQDLQNGQNTITLRAYVRGEPEAISQQRLILGGFTATATFSLSYQ